MLTIQQSIIEQMLSHNLTITIEITIETTPDKLVKTSKTIRTKKITIKVITIVGILGNKI